MKIYKGAFYGCMPKESFNGINVRSLVQQMSCKAVAQRMNAGAFVYAGFFFAMVKAL